MAEMYLSSDRGLEWGNVVITPQELTNYILGIDIVEGLLVFDGVKFVNHEGREYITDQEGKRHSLISLIERIENESLHKS
jgi:hypothetical protein